MAQSPTTPNATIALETEDLDVLDEPANVVVDLAPLPADEEPEPEPRRGGAWLVVVVYVVAVAALSLAIYERFFT